MEEKKIKITKDTTVAEVLNKKPQTAGVFFAMGMHCLGCVIAQNETVEQAAEVHGIEVEELLKKLNEA
jgi:hybrid cluster-associated redox disulfide protein